MSQTLKPLTAAQKLGVHLPATPEEFQSAELTRDEVERLKADPPPWLLKERRVYTASIEEHERAKDHRLHR